MNIDVSADVQAAWASVFPRHDPDAAWQPTWFEETEGFLVVTCINQTWKKALRLHGPTVMEKLNAALPTPRIKRVVAAIREVRVLVTGSRSWADGQAITGALLDSWHDAIQVLSPDVRFVVVHGDCPQGADALAKQWATTNGLIHEPHAADWAAPCGDACPDRPHRKTSKEHGEYCPLAGHHRNQFMVDLGADLVLAFHRNNSRGTADCIRRAKKAGIPVRILEEQT